MPLMSPTPFVLRGQRDVFAEPADATTVDDDAEVIGVAVEGRFRAYLLSAMSKISTHVIDDLIEGVPVTATVRDRTSFARVFTGAKSDEPLEIGLGGWMGEEMLLQINGRFFLQNSRAAPCADLSFEKTTWKEWKSAHPETDILTGAAVGSD